MQRTLCPFLAIGTVCGMSMVAAASTESDVVTQLNQRIAELEAKVAQISSNSQDDWLTDQRAAEVRAIVQDVLADADTRASLLGSGMSAGYDGGFFLASADGNYRLRIGGRTQIRYVYNFQDDGPGDRHRSGFENRRNRLVFSGHVVDPSWGFQIQGDFSRDGGSFSLLDAYVDKKFDNGMTLRMGQFRPKFMFEDSMSSARQLTVERSLVNSAFAQGRTQGVELRGSAGDNIQWSAAYTDGIGAKIGDASRANNTPWNSRTTEFSFMGRVEFLAAGNWRQFREFTSWSDEEFGLLLGAAGVWQRDEYGTADSNTEVFRWTVDATAKFGGANGFIAFVGNHEDTKSGGPSVDQYGLVVQGGFFFVPDEWEGFVRYEWGDTDGMGKDLSVITFGVNKYFAKHNIKWTTDVGVGINEVASFWSSSSAGWRTDAVGEDGQVVVRSQLQLAF